METALEEIEQAEAAQDAASGSVGDLDLTKPQTADKDALIEAQQTIEDALNNHGENYTDEEKAKLEELLDKVETALEEIEQAEAAGSTDAIDKVQALDPDKVQTSDKGTLEQAKEDLEAALGQYGESYTDEEKAKLEELLDKVETALGVIEKAEAVQGAVDALPDTVAPDDLETIGKIEAAKEQYDQLTDQEKELAGGAGEKLDQLLAAMIDYRILEGDGSVWNQEGGETLSIRANGAPAKLVDLLLDGSSIPAEGYTIRSGSTIATLTPAYLATLAPGQHTLTFVYQDGQVSATFTIAAKTADDTTSGGNAGSDGTAAPDAPNTGDPTSPALWAALALVCIAALAAVLIWQRKRAQR